jgi:hypothetical protein
MPMVGRVGAVCAANRRSRHTHSANRTTKCAYSFGDPTLKQVDISETTSVDSKTSVLSSLKQQVQEKTAFLKKQKEALVQKVQKGFNISRVPTPSRAAANRPRAKTCPDGHELEGCKMPRAGGWCDGCHASVELGQHMMSCRSCNYDVCDSCFGQAPAPQDDDFHMALAETAVQENRRPSQAPGTVSFAPPARSSIEVETSAHPEDIKAARPAKAEESEIEVDIEESKADLAVQAIEEQPSQTEEDPSEVLAAAVISSVIARAVEKSMQRKAAAAQQV